VRFTDSVNPQYLATRFHGTAIFYTLYPIPVRSDLLCHSIRRYNKQKLIVLSLHTIFLYRSDWVQLSIDGLQAFSCHEHYVTALRNLLDASITRFGLLNRNLRWSRYLCNFIQKIFCKRISVCLLRILSVREYHIRRCWICPGTRRWYCLVWVSSTRQ
jgi:hypothetical protein